ncbi:hypothetical protein H175_328p061 (plasmid) [Bacillus thuringiensis serovar thuringiensis str. IS5056]|nr:hypothetical protein H175_328p061 [Bacillus thuringiensis serovar thuringiensis str. IS5056]
MKADMISCYKQNINKLHKQRPCKNTGPDTGLRERIAS